MTVNREPRTVLLTSCPKCGADRLVVRTNSETGERFVGCSRYPDCTYTRDVPQSLVMREQGQPELWDSDND